MEYAQFISEAAIYDTGLDIEPDSDLITLSTCSYHIKDGRLIIVAKGV